MSEDTIRVSDSNPSSGATEQVQAGGMDQDNQDKVAYETYKRTLSEAKKYKSQYSEMQSKLEQYEREKLQAEGKKDEVIQKLMKEKEELYSNLTKTKQEFAYNQIRTQVELKAKEMGCVDTDALTKLVDFDGLDVLDGYKVSPQSLEMVLTKAKQEKSYLFSRPAPTIRDGAPNNSVSNGKVDFSKMSSEQLKAFAMKQGIK